MRVTVLGTGLLGAPMAEALIRHGHIVTVWNRSLEKTAGLGSIGAKVAGDPASAIAASDCTILMLADANAIAEVVLSPQTAGHITGRTIIQMGTISPFESKEIEKSVVARGGEYLEAPVLGSVPETQKSSLIVMVGAEPEQFERWQLLLHAFGPCPILIGPVGHAAAVKLAMNQLIASMTAAFSLSLGLVQHLSIDTERFMAVVRSSAVYAPTYDKKLQRMLERDYERPNFPIKHLKKDVSLFLKEASAAGLATQCLIGLDDILNEAVRCSLADKDYSALFDIVTPKNDGAFRHTAGGTAFFS